MAKASTKFEWRTIGHDTQKQFLLNAIEQNRMAHAYLLSGPKSTGKTTFAEDVARMLLGSLSDLKQSPDYYLIDQQEEIKISDIRALISRFSLSAISQDKRVGIISGIERASTESLNALLKILEEPKGQAYFFLTTDQPGVLPQTIISRVQKLNFILASDKEIEKALLNFTIDDSKREQIINFSNGKIGQAISMAQDEEYLETVSEREESLSQMLAGKATDRINLAQEIAGEESGEIKTILRQWLESKQLEFTAQPDQTDLNSVYKSITAIENALKQLERNANRKLVLDNLAISL